jgi:hypothetical protein
MYKKPTPTLDRNNFKLDFNTIPLEVLRFDKKLVKEQKKKIGDVKIEKYETSSGIKFTCCISLRQKLKPRNWIGGWKKRYDKV